MATYATPLRGNCRQRERCSLYSVERQARETPDAEPLKVDLKVEPKPSPQGAMNRRPRPPDLWGNYGHFFFLTFCVSALKGGALEKIFMGPSKGETLVNISVGLVSHTAVDWRASLPPPRGVSPPEMSNKYFTLTASAWWNNYARTNPCGTHHGPRVTAGWIQIPLPPPEM